MELDSRRIEKCFDKEYRIVRLNELRAGLGLAPFDFPADCAEGPAVGIEIEMTWWQAFPDMERWHTSAVRPRDLDKQSMAYHQFDQEYDANDKRLRPLLEHVAQVIPRVGNDAYWEFSFLPTHHVDILAAELATLYDLGVLREDVSYASHLTVAGVENDRDAFALLVSCELAGGTTPERLLQPVTTQKGAWSRRPDSLGGLRRRQAHELYGSDTCGYEFRTLVATSCSQMVEVISTAQALTQLLQSDPAHWQAKRGALEEMLRAENLPVSTWPNPRDGIDLWHRYAGVVDERQGRSTARGAENIIERSIIDGNSKYR